MNHPQRARRQAAATALVELGEPVLELLSELREQQPFETQAAIDEIIRDIPQFQRGVAIVYLTPDGPAKQKGIQLGDVFVAVDGKPTVDHETLLQSEVLDYRNRPRTVRVRRADEFFEVPFDAGRYGVFWTNYDASYGRHLSAALRAFEQKNYPAGRTAFDAAVAAGLQGHEDAMLRTMYVVCGYYGRRVQESSRTADEWLVEILAEEVARDGAHSFSRLLQLLTPGDDHLSIRIVEAIINDDPDARGGHAYLAYIHADRTRRYGEAAAAAAAALSGYSELSPDLQAMTLHALGLIQAQIGADVELEATLERLAGHAGATALWRWHAASAERLGLWDLSTGVLEKMLATQWDPNVRWWAVEHLLRLHVRENRLEEARRLLMDHTRNPAEFAHLPLDTLNWPISCSLWAEAARQALRVRGADTPALLNHAFNILVFQPQPDAAELASILDRLRATAGSEGLRNVLDQGQARTYMVAGEYQKALDTYDHLLQRLRSRPAQVRSGLLAERQAAAFLAAHGHALSGEHEDWRQAMFAFPVPDGPTWLVTRDQRIARAHDGVIHEVPAPSDWWPWLQQAIVPSTSGKTVLLASGNRIYRLGSPAAGDHGRDLLPDDAEGWTQLANMPASNWGLVNLAPVLDELVDILDQRDPEARAIVLPAEQPAGRSTALPFMLADGTWLVHRRDPQRLIDVSAGLSRAAGRRVLIHDMVPRDETRSGYYLASDAGLFTWNVPANEFAAVKLPDRDEPAPVMFLHDGSQGQSASREQVPRIATPPGAGGQIYSLDLQSGQIDPEHSVNESLPPAYWHSQPAHQRIAIVRGAVEHAGLQWPNRRLD